MLNLDDTAPRDSIYILSRLRPDLGLKLHHYSVHVFCFWMEKAPPVVNCVLRYPICQHISLTIKNAKHKGHSSFMNLHTFNCSDWQLYFEVQHNPTGLKSNNPACGNCYESIFRILLYELDYHMVYRLSLSLQAFCIFNVHLHTSIFLSNTSSMSFLFHLNLQIKNTYSPP